MSTIDAFAPVRQFEAALCEYTGAPYAVAVSSCTMALLLAVAYQLGKRRPQVVREVVTSTGHHAMAWEKRPIVEIPKRTYVSVPQSIIHGGGIPIYRDEEWIGEYQLKPLPVWDSARRFTSYMYRPGQFQCLSFHQSKILGDSQGGSIIHDDPVADQWLRRARFDGRAEGIHPRRDHDVIVGWHCYMSPDIAARLTWKLSKLARHNPDLPNDDYPDLSQLEGLKCPT